MALRAMATARVQEVLLRFFPDAFGDDLEHHGQHRPIAPCAGERDRDLVVLAAARIGRTRLIDNVEIRISA